MKKQNRGITNLETTGDDDGASGGANLVAANLVDENEDAAEDGDTTEESTSTNRVVGTGRAVTRRNQRLNLGELEYPKLADLADLDNCVDRGRNFAASCIHVVLDTKGSNQYKDRYTCVNCRRIWSMDTEYNKLRKASKQAAPTTSLSWQCDPDWR